jgi:hypothetical protein
VLARTAAAANNAIRIKIAPPAAPQKSIFFVFSKYAFCITFEHEKRSFYTSVAKHDAKQAQYDIVMQ